MSKQKKHYGIPSQFNPKKQSTTTELATFFYKWVFMTRLKKLLKAPVSNWRWALVYAAAPAVVVGFLFTEFTPEWVELAFGGPAILIVYMAVIWKRGFREEDKVLFRKNATLPQEILDAAESTGKPG